MNRILIVCTALLFVSVGNIYAQTINNEIEDELYGTQQVKEQNMSFQSFSSCEDMASVIETFVQENWETYG